MTDLSHWDFADTFHIEEAAELIVGCNPDAAIGIKPKKITLSTAAKPVFNRMHDASVVAMRAMRGGQNCPPDGLMFLELEQIAQDSKPRNLLLSILDTMVSTGEEYRIRREEIGRWLSAIGMKSVYQFDRSQPPAIEKVSGHWPWGDHHTELLGHLEAAAKRYWVNYEPTDATTAPTNKEVAEWLMNERKLSQKMAESIASMLRPDGLATGPRK